MKMTKQITALLLTLLMAVGMAWVPGLSKPVQAKGEIDLEEVFNEWVNYPGSEVGPAYQAGWAYNPATGDIHTTANVGFTGYYNPKLMNFTTGTFGCDFQSSDTDPWGFAWGIQKWKNAAGQDCYSFYIYEECGDNCWSVSHIEEWIPSKDTAPHKGPVYHGIINGTDSQKTHNGANTGTAGFAKGKVLAYGSGISVRGVKHHVTIKVEKNSITIDSTAAGAKTIKVDAPVQAGSFGPCSASNAGAYFYNLSMEAAEDNGALRAGFEIYNNGTLSGAGKYGDTVSLKNTSWLDPDTNATLKSETWTIYNSSGQVIYSGNTPYSGVLPAEGEYKIVLEILSSQGLTAKKTKYFTVTNETTVTIRYIDSEGNRLCDDLVYHGKPGSSYSSFPLSFNGYVLYEVEGEEKGKFQEFPLSVTYLYNKLPEGNVTPDPGEDTAKPVTVTYVDEEGNPLIANPIVYTGEVGISYKTQALNFPGYTLIATEGEPEGKFSYQAKTVVYKYKADSTTASQAGSVIVRYVNEEGVTLSKDVVFNGPRGTSFVVDKLNIGGYEIKEIQGPESGKLTNKVQVVTVVYTPVTYTACSVVATYVDEEGNLIANDVIINGNSGDPYITEELENPGWYRLKKIEGSPTGTMIPNQVQIVKYIYTSSVDLDIDGDGKPDINIDIDGDGKPDINLDTDNDNIPDVNVDTDNDGKPDKNVDTDGDGRPDKNVDTDGDGRLELWVDTWISHPDKGAITKSTLVNIGDSHTVTWTVSDPDYEVRYVYVDKVSDESLVEEGVVEHYNASRKTPVKTGTLIFDSVTEYHNVGVVLARPGDTLVDVDIDGDGKPDVNVDTDYDGEPDINIDTDGDGNPDLDIDIDGDGKPDVNVDTDGDKIPDINIDTDGDKKPDVNIDTDGDKKPDVNIDTDGDKKPDINIDTDGDKKPDVNVDIDGDKKPDINIDTDGDGKPDVDIDTDNDKKPDVNVDTDGDNIPDINIDTDGDKKPDVNVDIDGDKKPDINIDTDGDKKPDVDIDTDNDGKPDVNVDTDGDKIPDINIDTDGDGKPDVDIDTDNDGKPDVNVDTDGDKIPDINIDTDGDKKPDVNVDTDGDKIPDINIDTDGDKKPDVDIDTDNDGKPDVNVDTDGDKIPDINIDTDGDKKPDVNIDTNNDGKPNVNVDTDGDKIPDINIDTDGDKKPDVNIDTNNDGKPDVNVDTDGDKKPDINIDTDGDGNPDLDIDIDGDGKPDVNVDTNGDKKPDINIDTDGDGKPDLNIDENGNGIVDKYENSIQTGDTANFVSILFVTLLSSGALVLLLIKKRKKAQ